MENMNKRGPRRYPGGLLKKRLWQLMIGHQVLHIVCVQTESWLSNHGGDLWPHCVIFSSEVYCAAPCRRPWKSPGEYKSSVLLRLDFSLGRLWKELAGFQLIVASWSHVGNQLIILVCPCVWWYDCGLCAPSLCCILKSTTLDGSLLMHFCLLFWRLVWCWWISILLVLYLGWFKLEKPKSKLERSAWLLPWAI